MKNPNKTTFNLKLISKMSESEFVKLWKTADFDGNAKEWYAKLTGKKKA